MYVLFGVLFIKSVKESEVIEMNDRLTTSEYVQVLVVAVISFIGLCLLVKWFCKLIVITV